LAGFGDDRRKISNEPTKCKNRKVVGFVKIINQHTVTSNCLYPIFYECDKNVYGAQCLGRPSILNKRASSFFYLDRTLQRIRVTNERGSVRYRGRVIITKEEEEKEEIK
jgi:hypothetical protein